MFVQDNTPIHWSKSTLEWLGTKQITLMEFPPYSLDLNPIENIWGLLKDILTKQLSHRFPVGSSEEVQEETVCIIEDGWWSTLDKNLREVIQSIKKRVDAIIKNKGWYSSY